MRLTGLLAVLLFIVIVFFAAPAASYAQAPADQDRPVFHDKSADESLQAMRDFAARSGWELERDGVCYTLRTYVMARDEKDSDSTHAVRVTRCLPGNRIQFKTAVAPERPASPPNR
jgi:hypothetical protein